jgi:RNA polymerase sigma-70 factor (ECF subfamily)
MLRLVVSITGRASEYYTALSTGMPWPIADRYANNRKMQWRYLMTGFLKFFREIHHYKPAYTDVISSFKGWLRKIMVYTAIDHFRKNQKHQMVHTAGQCGISCSQHS